MTNELHNRAMLATLTISQWTNRKHDKSVSAEVERNHQAKDAGRYNKQLLDKSALDPINKIASAARAYHYKMTLPWGDNNDRLLPSALFMDYTDSMRNFKTEFAQRVSEFVKAYPALVQGARTRLGSLYDPADFPAEIASRFGIVTSFTPVPSASDFRVDLNTEVIEKIKSEITLAVHDRQREAVKHCWSRARDIVGNIQERLSDQDKVFRDSLIENAREFVSILPSLNVTGDPELISIEQDIRSLLVNPETLRADPGKRNEVAERAAAIMSKMEGYFQ